MKVRTCSPRHILQPCELSGYLHQIDPYVGCEHHCYYCYALNQAETDWTQEILIHRDFADQLSGELSKLDPQPIYFGWNSDPYQPAEAVYRHTRNALEMLANDGFSVCILTKSDLVTRDIDVIARMPESSVGFSIAFQDEVVRELFEAKAPPNHCKIAALKALKEAGVETYTLICPLMPYLSDIDALIEMVVPYSDTIWFYALSMESQGDRNWGYVGEILERNFPELIEKYKQIAFSSDHPYWANLRQELEEIRSKNSLNMRIRV